MTTVDALALERELTSLAIEGDGWEQLLEHFATRTGIKVSLIGVHGESMLDEAHMPGAPTALPAGEIAATFARGAHISVFSSGQTVVGLPLLAGSRRIGILASYADASDTATLAPLFEAARTAIAVESVRRDTLQQAREENASRTIDELRYGSLRDPSRVARAAAKFGIVLDRPHMGVVFHYPGEQRHAWATAVSWLPTPTRLSHDLAWTVVDGASPLAALKKIRMRMQGIVGDTPLKMSIGSVVSGAENTARSFRTAETCLGVLLERGGETISFEDLGAEQLMLELSPTQLHDFAQRQIGPLLTRDDLMTTLRLWFELDGSRGAIAERLFLHRNSVGYRLGLIKQLVGANCFDPTESPRLLAGLQANEVALAMERFAILENEERLHREGD